MGNEDIKASEEITGRHDRDYLFRNSGDTAHAAEEYKTAGRRNNDADEKAVHAKGVVKGVGDGVRLHHVADEAEGHDDRHREEYRKPLALKAARNVIGRTADDAAVGHLFLIDLREHRLREDRRHSEEGRDPHPEDCSRAAYGDRRRRSGEVSRTDLRGDRRRKGLERAHTVLVGALTEKGQLPKGILERHGKFAYLDKIQPQRKVKPRAAEKRNKTIKAPNKTIGLRHQYR